MNWDAVGAIGEVAGSVAVFVTLGYLAAQIRYTRRQLESQEINDYQRDVLSAYDPVYVGRNAEVFRAGLEQPDSLGASDAFLFNLLMHRQFGLIELQGFPCDVQNVLRLHYQEVLLSRPGGRAWLDAHRETFPRACALLGFASAGEAERSPQRAPGPGGASTNRGRPESGPENEH